MRYVLIVILTMINAAFAIHLGLTEVVAKLLTKILNCPKCLTFWSSMILLYIVGCNIIIAVLLSLLSAYLSNWFSLLLAVLSKEYTKLWQKLNK